MMSFAGSIGQLMDGSGLEDCLQTVFGSSSVPKMFEGKAIARALRAHFLTEASLATILLSSFIPASANGNDGTLHSSEERDVEEDEDREEVGKEEEGWDGEEDGEEDYESFEQSDALIDLDNAQLRQLKEDEVDELKDIYECLENDY